MQQRYRVTTSTAAVADQPVPLELAALVDEVDRSGVGGFLVAERRGPSGRAALQARRDRIGWLLQVSDSRTRAGAESRVAGVTEVLSALVAWTTDRALDVSWADPVRLGRTAGRCASATALAPLVASA